MSGNLSKAPVEILMNTVNGSKVGIFYKPSTKRVYLHLKEAGVVIPGREINRTIATALFDQTAGNVDKEIKLDISSAALTQIFAVCSAGKTTAGTKKKITLTPQAVSYAAGKDVTVEVISVPRLQGVPEFNNQVAVSRFYQIDTDTITQTATGICDAIRTKITEDIKEKIVTGTGSTTLILESDSAELQFEVHTEVIDKSTGAKTVGFTQTLTTAGVYPVLTHGDILRNFPIKEGDVGGNPKRPLADTNYARYKFQYKELEDHPGVTSASELVSKETTVIIYAPVSEISKQIIDPDWYGSAGTNIAWTAATAVHTGETDKSDGSGLSIGQLFEICFAETGSMVGIES